MRNKRVSDVSRHCRTGKNQYSKFITHFSLHLPTFPCCNILKYSCGKSMHTKFFSMNFRSVNVFSTSLSSYSWLPNFFFLGILSNFFGFYYFFLLFYQKLVKNLFPKISETHIDMEHKLILSYKQYIYRRISL